MTLIRTIGKSLPDWDIPWQLTIRHFYFFGPGFFSKNEKLDTELNWQRLRSYHPFFKLPENEAAWAAQCERGVDKDGQDGCLPQKAVVLAQVLKDKVINDLISIGAGEACLEYHLRKIYPELKFILTEYTDDNVNVLKRVFKGAEVFKLDALKIDWQQFAGKKNSVLFLFRIDASFTDEQLQQIFEKMHAAGVENVIYVPNLFLTFKFLLYEKARAFLNRLFGRELTFAGYFRTKKRSRQFWRGLYEEEDLNLCGAESIKRGGSRGVFLKRM